MISEEEFVELLQRPESPTLDFKATVYDLSSDDSKIDLIKDVLCMANTPREETSYLILGVKKYSDGRFDLLGLEKHLDDADLQSQFADRVHPIPKLSYQPVQHGSRSFGVIAIPPERRGPFMLAKALFDNTIHKNKLQRGKIYFRQGSQNKVATLPDEINQVVLWCNGQAIAPQLEGTENVAWSELLDSVGRFEAARSYVLVCCKIDHERTGRLDALGTIPWSAVIDFDPQSETSGLFAASATTLKARHGLHVVLPGGRPDLGLGKATYWYFPRGTVLPGQPGDGSVFKTWIKERAGFLSDFLRKVGSMIRPRPVMVVAVWYGETPSTFLDSCLDAALSNFGTAAEIVIVTSDQVRLENSAERIDATIVTLPLDQLCGGLSSMVGSGKGELDQILLPSSSGAPIPVAAKELGWLEEELEIVHRSLGMSPPAIGTIGRDFLKGAEISWYELGVHYDVDRDLATPLGSKIRTDLRGRQTVRTNLYHAPGAGGTTLARRICWDFRHHFPCVRLLRTRPRETIERLKFLASMTGLPILVALDGSDVAERDADDLFELARAYHLPAVFLQVSRRVDAGTGKRSFFLPFLLSPSEANRFAHVLAREEPSKKAALERLEGETNPALRNAFYFGLVAFEREFAGLEPFVRMRLLSATVEQSQVLLYLAFAHHFGQSSLPAQAFADILGAPRNLPVDLRKYLTLDLRSLLLEDGNCQWRTLHDLVALEIIEQLLSSGAADRRVWRYALAERAREFAYFLRGSDADPSDALSELTRRIYLYRENIEYLGKESSASGAFSRLIEAIPVPESALGVVMTLTDLYPEDAHIWAHLGRYYNARMKNTDEALRCIDRAIAINDQDHVILHMKGMILRTRTYALINDGADLDFVIEAARAASDVFQRTRAVNPDAEHSYISEVQLIIKVLDYAAKKKSTTALDVLRVPGTAPYLRDAIDLVETLLDGVRRIRPADEPSHYEATCRNQLDALYGDYQVALQAWDALLARTDVYRPTIRRHIVWTHLARRGRSWDNLHPREVERINALLEENLREEQFDDRNLRLWIQAARRRNNPPSLDIIIERIAQWKANSGSLDATYYLYVCYALDAMNRSPSAREFCSRFLEECRQRARFRADRSKSFEWLGAGQGISRLVHHSTLGDWDRDQQFWSRKDRLVRVTGRITRIEGPQAGEITTGEGLAAFFVPGSGGFGKGQSENEIVSFYLGFSYDGVRAWDVLPINTLVET